MDIYQILGLVSIALLSIAMSLSIFILIGHHSRKTTYFVSGFVLFLMIVMSVICIFIYAKYGGHAIS